jgi:hypothetical protein
MRAEHHTSRARWMAPLLALTIVCGLLVAAEEPAKPAAADAPKVSVFTLKYTRAEDMARLLAQLLGNKGHSFAADERTNSIVVSGQATEMEQIQAVLARLDVPTAAEDSARIMRLKTFSLESTEPDDSVQSALQVIFNGGRPGNFSLDRQRKMVIVYADDPTLKTVEDLLRRMDERRVPRPEMDLQLRVLWLVSGTPPGDPQPTPPPPDDVKEVLPGLAKLGVTRPWLNAQMLVNVQPNVQFQVKGVPSLLGSQFSVTGSMSLEKQTPSVNVTLRATRGQVDGNQPDIANLQTEITAPVGHMVVLGVTPTDAMTSVFVLQVLPRDAKKPAPQK